MPDRERRTLPVFRPVLGEEESAAVARVLGTGWVTQGPEVAAFEREFAQFTGAAHACAVSSCTAALHLALKAVGAGPGHEVITASHSFMATANSVRYTGAIPVFVDVQPGTYNLDPALVERAISPRTRAILAVHQLGMPCDLRKLVEIARLHGLPLIEDAACAAGSEVSGDKGWERIGKPHGDIACFSFHPRKLLTTGDGGMLTTGRAQWDAQFRLWRQHGMSVSDTVRHAARQVILESYTELGFNYRLTDIQAAVGREQLRRLAGVVERRRAQVQIYRDLLGGVPGLSLPAEPPWARSNWQSFCLLLPDRVEQRSFMQSMLDADISVKRGVMCAHREPAYRAGGGEPWSCEGGKDRCSCGAGGCRRLRTSEQSQDHGVVLPLYHDLSREDQERIAGMVRRLCGA